VLARVEERLSEQYGRAVVPTPGRAKAYQVLNELTRGTNAFTGSTKAKRSIANLAPAEPLTDATTTRTDLNPSSPPNTLTARTTPIGVGANS
jgi:hypothetical protein